MTQSSPRTFLLQAAVVAAALGIAACATTQYASTWKDDSVQRLGFAGQKIAALVVSRDAGLRRPAEEALAREMTAHGVQGIPAYALLSDDDRAS